MRESERDREGENLKKINRELDRDGEIGRQIQLDTHAIGERESEPESA